MAFVKTSQDCVEFWNCLLDSQSQARASELTEMNKVLDVSQVL